MRILLPPSEGKTTPTVGPALDLDALTYPQLGQARAQVIASLVALGDGPNAAATLKLGAKSAVEATLNLHLSSAPCAPAFSLYTGVLFEALDAPTFSPGEWERFTEMTLISSGLFGFVGPKDPIPNHRLAVGVNLPPLGPLARWWRPHLERALGDLSGTVVFDARSGGYQAAAPVASANVVQMGVIRDEGGQRKVVTHMAKKWRGLATSHLLKDRTITAESPVEAVLVSLEEMTRSEHLGDETMSLEVGSPERNRAGGSKVQATLVVSV